MHDVVRKILDMLQRSTIANREISDPRQRFWTIYRTAAEEFDNEFLKKYDGDMDTSMIFVSFLSFIFNCIWLTFLEGWPLLRRLCNIPDYNDV